MADTLSTVATQQAATTPYFQDVNQESYYQNLIKTLPSETIEQERIQYEPQTLDSISSQVSKYLRNYYDKSIKSRQAQTVQNNASLDVDAASRGMGASTWLTDAKNRQYQSEAADIAGLEGDYNSALAEQVSGQYQNYLSNKLTADTQNAQNKIEVDEWNSKIRVALEQLAYERTLEAIRNGFMNVPSTGSSGGSSSSGPSGGGGGITLSSTTTAGAAKEINNLYNSGKITDKQKKQLVDQAKKLATPAAQHEAKTITVNGKKVVL